MFATLQEDLCRGGDSSLSNTKNPGDSVVIALLLQRHKQDKQEGGGKDFDTDFDVKNHSI